MQTRKIDRHIPVVLYGSSYWNEIINFEALVRHGMIDREDLALFQFADDPATALGLLQAAHHSGTGGRRRRPLHTPNTTTLRIARESAHRNATMIKPLVTPLC